MKPSRAEYVAIAGLSTSTLKRFADDVDSFASGVKDNTTDDMQWGLDFEELLFTGAIDESELVILDVDVLTAKLKGEHAGKRIEKKKHWIHRKQQLATAVNRAEFESGPRMADWLRRSTYSQGRDRHDR